MELGWTLADLHAGKIGDAKNGLKVFSCFSGGGGSSMGYQLAGFQVISGLELDLEMAKLYTVNCGYVRHEDIRKFNAVGNIGAGIDILDGSPPCSVFSTAGDREKNWGKKKQFREGQAFQPLDDLFFHFIDTAKQLRPKVVIAENVKGIVQGKAAWYTREIVRRFNAIGYDCQLFLLNAARMGVPQRRERAFFIARLRDLNLAPLKLKFTDPEPAIGPALEGCQPAENRVPSGDLYELWRVSNPGMNLRYADDRGHKFGAFKMHPDFPTITLNSASSHMMFRWDEFRELWPSEFCRVQTFPDDYEFLDQKAGYVCGMSVPPFMMWRLAREVARQFFNR